jgi:hypothetical protein
MFMLRIKQAGMYAFGYASEALQSDQEFALALAAQRDHEEEVEKNYHRLRVECWLK